MALVFFDIDGTLTSAHVWGGLMAYFKSQGKKQGVHRAYLATHYPLYFLRKAKLLSEYTFRYRWSADLGWYLRGETEASAAAIGDWVAQHYLEGTWHAPVLARLQEHLQRGDTVILVSAAPQPLVAAIARHWGVPHAVGTRYALAAGRYTGRVIPPPVLNAQKRIQALAYLRSRGLPTDLHESWAYADSITDLALLEAAAHPVAVFPDKALRSVAEQRGWEIIAD